jgi:CHAD domain-containing protein
VAGASLKRTLEQELKLEPTPEFALEALGGEPAATRVFTSVYHDSADRSLARLGITLRRRTENGKSVWQLKLPRPSGRLELEASGGPAAPPAELASLLRAPLLDRELTPVAELRTRRSVVRLHGPDDALAEVVHDAVEVMEGRRVAERFAEVEVELVAGNGGSLQKLGKRVAEAGAEPSDGRPKVFRALGLAGTAEGLPADAPFASRLGAMLRRQVDAIRVGDPGVRLGDDAEDVHDLRVAVRRLRAVLRAARTALPAEWVEPLRAELRWLGSEVMGPLRDLDVLVAHLVDQAEALGGEDIETALTALLPLEAEHVRARNAVLAALDGERYLALLTALDNSVDAPPVVADASPEQIAAKEFRKLGKHLDAVDADSSDEELHGLRIRGKKARYAAELAEPVAGKPARRFVESAKRLQDVLGEHQDAIVAEERLRSLLRGTKAKSGAFALGRLVERERERRAEARLELAAAKADVARRGRQAWA